MAIPRAWRFRPAAKRRETAGQIEDDFHTLFGEAFLYAYDMEVNQYKDSQSGSEE